MSKLLKTIPQYILLFKIQRVMESLKSDSVFNNSLSVAYKAWCSDICLFLLISSLCVAQWVSSGGRQAADVSLLPTTMQPPSLLNPGNDASFGIVLLDFTTWQFRFGMLFLLALDSVSLIDSPLLCFGNTLQQPRPLVSLLLKSARHDELVNIQVAEAQGKEIWTRVQYSCCQIALFSLNHCITTLEAIGGDIRNYLFQLHKLMEIDRNLFLLPNRSDKTKCTYYYG